MPGHFHLSSVFKNHASATASAMDATPTNQVLNNAHPRSTVWCVSTRIVAGKLLLLFGLSPTIPISKL